MISKVYKYLAILLLLIGVISLSQAQTPKAESDTRLKSEVVRLRKLIAVETDRVKVLNFKRNLVMSLIWLDAPSTEIIEVVGDGIMWSDPMLYIQLSELLADRGEFLDTALEYYRRAVSIPSVPNDAIPRYTFFLTLSYIQIKRGEFEKAIDTLLVGHPGPYYLFRDDRWLYYLGLAYQKSGRIDEAIESYIRLAGGTKPVSAKPDENLRDLYRKRYGSLDGLEEKIEATRIQTRQKAFVEDRLINNGQAYKWTLQNLSGNDVSLSDFSGNVVVMIFVNTQFEDDVEQLKFHEDLASKYKSQPVVFICIDEGYPHPMETRRKNVANALKQKSITLQIVIDPDGKVQKQFNTSESSVFLIDDKGMTRIKNSRWEKYQPFIADQIDYLLQHRGSSAK